MIRIGDLAAQSGVSVRALRYYEEQGLLTSARSASGQRYYEQAHAVDRVLLIQQLFAAGLSSRTIAKLMPCVDANEPDEESTALMVAERDRIDRQIQDLISTRNRLDDVIASSRDASSCVHAAEPLLATAS